MKRGTLTEGARASSLTRQGEETKNELNCFLLLSIDLIM